MHEYFPQVKITELQATYLLWLDFRAFNLSFKELTPHLLYQSDSTPFPHLHRVIFLQN